MSLNVKEMVTFGIDDAFPEAVVRGYRGGLLSPADYVNLAQSEILEDMKLHLAGTDYGNFLQNEPSPLATTTIYEKLMERLVYEFDFLEDNAVAPLTNFLQYVRYGYMIDNVILILTGTLHDRDTSELVEKCNPLGLFDTISTLSVATTVQDLYRTVLIDTPLANYFRISELKSEDLDELNIEIIRNTLWKAYLEDFYRFCNEMGGTTGEVMAECLKFEADRRVITITCNSFGTDLNADDRMKLFPNFGYLYPEGTWALSRAEDMDSVRAIVDDFEQYRAVFEISSASEKSLEDVFFEKEVEVCKRTFDRQFQFGVFYGFLKLKEQEIRNIVWVAECVSQAQKDKITQNIIDVSYSA